MGGLVLVKGLVRELEGVLECASRVGGWSGARCFCILEGGVACVGAAFDGGLKGLRVGAYVEVFIVVWAVGFTCGASIGARSD